MERASHIDFDESRLMTSAVSDTGYWMAEATGDDAADVLDAGGEDLEHRQPPADVNPQAPDPITNSNLNVERFGSIPTQHSVNDMGDVGASNSESDKDPLASLENGLESHPDPSPDGTYSTRSKRSIQPSQKVLLNEKWGDPHMWARRAIAHSKYSRTLESERLYCRLTTLSVGDPNYHDFESEFDLIGAVQQIAEMRAYQAVANHDEMDNYEPLTYQQAIDGPYAKQWKEAMNKQIQSFAIMGT